MLQLDRDFPRPKSDIKRRTSLVIWLTVGFSLISLIFAYAFYMRYRDEEDQQIPWRDREAIVALLRSNGYVCTQICATDRDETGKNTIVTCGTAPAPNSCAQMVRYELSIASSANRS